MLQFKRLAIAMIGILIIVAACKPDDAIRTPTPTTPLPERAIIALQNLINYDSYVQTTNEYITNQTYLRYDGEIIYSLETEIETSTVSQVTFENDDPNVSAQITSIIKSTDQNDGSTRDLDYGMEAELRLVDNTLYLHAMHTNVESEITNDPPTGWQIINADTVPEFDGVEALGIPTWIEFVLNDGRLVGRMGEWMLSHYTSAAALTTQSTEINTQSGTFEDGTPVDVIRFSDEGLASGVANTIPLTATTPDGLAVLQAGIQYPSITFIIDQQNQMRSRIISYNVFVENIDAALIMETDANTRLSIIITVNIVESYSNINGDVTTVDAPSLLE